MRRYQSTQQNRFFSSVMQIAFRLINWHEPFRYQVMKTDSGMVASMKTQHGTITATLERDRLEHEHLYFSFEGITEKHSAILLKKVQDHIAEKRATEVSNYLKETL